MLTTRLACSHYRASGELMPTITHSVRSSDWAEAQFQILRTAQIIDSVREILRGQPSFN